ncbi:MAG TPA: hypothetical protein EYG72_02975 [Candidatus Pacebacteria bacterium]|nr:hypothetical protein [Candidatus Paceibacterota bacterium]
MYNYFMDKQTNTIKKIFYSIISIFLIILLSGLYFYNKYENNNFIVDNNYLIQKNIDKIETEKIDKLNELLKKDNNFVEKKNTEKINTLLNKKNKTNSLLNSNEKKYKNNKLNELLK